MAKKVKMICQGIPAPIMFFSLRFLEYYLTQFAMNEHNKGRLCKKQSQQSGFAANI